MKMEIKLLTNWRSCLTLQTRDVWLKEVFMFENYDFYKLGLSEIIKIHFIDSKYLWKYSLSFRK